MNVAVDSQWNRENSNFVMDNNDYEKAFENYISDDNGKFLYLNVAFIYSKTALGMLSY